MIASVKVESRIHTLAFDEVDISRDVAAALVDLFRCTSRYGRVFDHLSLEFCTGYVDLVVTSALIVDGVKHLFLALDAPNDDLFSRLTTTMRVNASLQSLSLLIPFTVPNAMALAEALRENETLEKLSISGSNFDKLDDDDDDDAGDDEETNVRSRSDTLDTDEFIPFDPFETAVALAEGLKDNLGLRAFELSSCYLSDEPLATLVSALAGHPNLQVLDLSRNGAGRQTMTALGEVLGNEYSKLVSLDVREQSDNGPFDISPFAQAMQNNISLESVKLSHNQLNDQQVMNLVDCLYGNETIQELDLQYNDLTDKGLGYLTEKLDAIKSLNVLLLGGNDFGEEGQHKLELLQEKDQDICMVGTQELSKPRNIGNGKKGNGMLSRFMGGRGAKNKEK